MPKNTITYGKNIIFIGVIFFCVFVHQICAAEASFQILTDSDGQPVGNFPTPRAVSADGSVVVGQIGLQEAFRWTATGGLVGLGYISESSYDESSAKGVSADGNIIVGYSSSVSHSRQAFRWTASDGMTSLLDPSSAEFFFVANSISGDGSTIVGSGYRPDILEAARWTQREGLVGLGQLPGGTHGSLALATSYDGSVIVGYSDFADNGGYFQAFRWTSKTGMIALGDLPGGPTGSLGRAVSADGSVVVGESWTEDGWHAYRWTQTTGMVALDGLGDVSIAEGVSGDGSQIVGTISFFQSPTQAERTVAFIWDAEHGMRDLNAVLEVYGLDLQGAHLSDATAISADGSTIVGRTDGDYGWYTWVAHLPNPLDQLIASVQGLSVSNGQKTDLLVDLRNAKRFAASGQCRQELQLLNVFVRKVSLCASKGVLDQNTAAALTASANSVTSQLECN
jgi:probable HAF family extracellular repeat protein